MRFSCEHVRSACLNEPSDYSCISLTIDCTDEKTKWVPIPAEELQAAADAQRASRSQGSARGRSRSHQQSQNRSQGSPSVSASPAGSMSGQDSQNRSRAQSSVARGNRRSGSQAGSATQSRAQSRAGSLQSSPKHSTVRRRLPEEVSGVLGARSNRSLRSSRAASPHIPSPYIQETGIAVSMARQIVAAPLAGSRSESPFYPSTVSAGHVPSPYTTTPVMNSPATSAYHLPPGAYAPPTLSPYPVPHYQPYPSYGYGLGQPYMFWGSSSSGPQSQNISQTHSPSTYPVQLLPTQEILPQISPEFLPPSIPILQDVSTNGLASTQASQVSSQSSTSEKARPRVLSFGSIDIASSVTPETLASTMSSDPGSNASATTESNGTAAPTLRGAVPTPSSQTGTVADKLSPAFSVGLAPGDPGPSRKRGNPSLSPVVQPQARGSVSGDGSDDQAVLPVAAVPSIEQGNEDIKALTAKTREMSVNEPKWEFGSTTTGERGASSTNLALLPGHVQGITSELRATLANDVPLDHLNDPAGLPTPVPASASATTLYAANSPLSPEDEWKVRDYGYGMGRPRGSAPSFVPREDRVSRDGGMTYSMRPRRGSYNDEPFERGGYSGRRGRGRGWSRGRGAYGGDGYGPRPPRGMPRQPYSPVLGGPNVPYDTTYYAVPPLGPYVPSGYEVYAPYPAYGSTPSPPQVVPPPTAQSTAPVPVPITKLSFPLDPLRYYLLGQLEYYLSDDNLAHDLFLRKNVSIPDMFICFCWGVTSHSYVVFFLLQMDDRGWVSIPLIASFNRIKQLTYELQLVKDMLMISSLVEVKGDWVRMHRWERYVLPDAPPSPLEGDIMPPANFAHQVNVEESVLTHPPSADPGAPSPSLGAGQSRFHYDDSQGHPHAEGEDGEDEDEDEVEFVLGGDADQSWTSDRNEV